MEQHQRNEGIFFRFNLFVVWENISVLSVWKAKIPQIAEKMQQTGGLASQSASTSLTTSALFFIWKCLWFSSVLQMRIALKIPSQRLALTSRRRVVLKCVHWKRQRGFVFGCYILCDRWLVLVNFQAKGQLCISSKLLFAHLTTSFCQAWLVAVNCSLCCLEKEYILHLIVLWVRVTCRC